MTKTAEPPISVREFAKRAGISVRLVYEHIESGEIEPLLHPPRIGAAGKRRHFTIEVVELEKYLARARERARKAARAS